MVKIRNSSKGSLKNLWVFDFRGFLIDLDVKYLVPESHKEIEQRFSIYTMRVF
jgi:hypothetical protein